MDTAPTPTPRERKPVWGWALAATVATLITGLAIVVLIPTWGDGWVGKAHAEILASPLFADPPPGWTEQYHTASSGWGDREHITASWTAPGTVDEAVKALHQRHGDQYTVRGPSDPNYEFTVVERWTRHGSQVPIQVAYHSTRTPNQVGITARISVPRELLKDPANRR